MNNQDDIHSKIKDYVLSFDKVLIDTLMIDRQNKYTRMFRNKDLPLEEDERKVPDDPHSCSHKTKKSPKKKEEEAYDSDEERENASTMFISDMQSLRNYFIKVIKENIEEMQ